MEPVPILDCADSNFVDWPCLVRPPRRSSQSCANFATSLVLGTRLFSAVRADFLQGADFLYNIFSKALILH